MELNWYKLTK